ncbi:vacuolar protein 8 [Abrus precatorius]|uniref:Vacuolar protein 8 n=1 Tax=Abrus precatorius TaxID=3816 RepID=A0A8B8KFV1_ABRPR|nr:vacuolar protein 8 [Abrus precatorius]
MKPVDWEQELNKYQNIMASGTKSMKIKAMVMLARFSKHAPEHVLSCTIPILTEILGDAISNDSAPSFQEAAAYCLKCIACRGNGQLAIEIAEHGAAHSLMRLLPHSDGRMKKVLMKFLLVIVSFCEESRIVVATNGGVEIIISLLNSCTDDTRWYLLEILSVLALRRDVRKALVRFEALNFVVEAAGVGSIVSRERACQAIGLLGVTRQARRMLVELGAIEALVELFHNGDYTTKLLVGNSLGVISAHVDYIRPVARAGAIPLYAELLQGHDPSGKEIAEDVFCILAVAETNAVEIAGHLVRILREGDDEAKASAVDVMWDLSGYKHSTSVVRNSGAIPILVELLRNGTEEVKVNASRVFAQLSYDGEDRMAFAGAGAIPILIDLMNDVDDVDEVEELGHNAAEALVNFYEDPLYHDRVSDAINVPLFRNMQNRLILIRSSNEHMARSLRRMSVEQLTRNLDLV